MYKDHHALVHVYGFTRISYYTTLYAQCAMKVERQSVLHEGR